MQQQALDIFPTPDIELIQGDCLEVMPDIENGSVDLTVASPPYDNLRTYNDSLVWNEDIWKAIIKELFRVTKQGGVVVWVVGDSTINGSETGTSFRQALYFKEIGFNLHDTMIWQKSKMPQNHNRYEQQFEYMFIFTNGKPNIFNGIRDKKNAEAGATAHVSYRDSDGVVKKTSSFNRTKIAETGLRYNVWAINPCLSANDRNGHPAPFPEQLAHDHIISWSSPGDVVLDCFAGSGTTGIMAYETGRDCILIEKDETYCDIIKERFKKRFNKEIHICH